MGNNYGTISDACYIKIQVNDARDKLEALPYHLTNIKELRKWIKQKYDFKYFTLLVRETGYHVGLADANFYCYAEEFMSENPTKTLVVTSF